jgi:hypothetical protein
MRMANIKRRKRERGDGERKEQRKGGREKGRGSAHLEKMEHLCNVSDNVKWCSCYGK